MKKILIFLTYLIVGLSIANGQQVPSVENIPVDNQQLINGQYYPSTNFSGSPESKTVYIPRESVEADNLDQVSALTVSGGEVYQTVNYQNGFNSTIQSIQVGQSNQQYDIVQSQYYNAYGRKEMSLKPYVDTDHSSSGEFKTGGIGNAYNYFRNGTETQSGSAFPFSQIKYKQTGEADYVVYPGDEYRDAGDPSNLANASHSTTSSVYSIGAISYFYIQDGELYKGTVAAGEAVIFIDVDINGLTSKVYKDFDGRLLYREKEKSLNSSAVVQTYYAYDWRGQMGAIIPPLAAYAFLAMPDGVISESEDAFQKYVYRTKYNDQGLEISTKRPGAGEECFVYDSDDKPVLSQTATQRVDNEWNFIKYDIFDRPVIKGVYIDARSRDEIQFELDRLIPGAVHFDPEDIPGNKTGFDIIIKGEYEGENLLEANKAVELVPGYDYEAALGAELELKIASGNQTSNTNYVLKYTDKSFPSLENSEIHIVSFYDSYDQVSLEPSNGLIYESHVPGSLTGMRYLDFSSNTYLESASFYDLEGRLVETRSQNHKGGEDVFQSNYDWEGKLLSSTTIIENPEAVANNIITVEKRYAYQTHSGRLLSVEQQINGSGWTTIGQYVYDEMGLMHQKVIGGGLQTIDYKYDINGRLTDINDINNLGDDYFAMQLSFSHGFTNQYIDGKLAGVKWQVNLPGEPQHAYGYHYDGLGRMTRADYVAKSQGSSVWDYEPNRYTVFGINYDDHGNISTLNREGDFDLETGTYGSIDRLVYDYNGNQLVNLRDNSSTQGTGRDFNEESTSTTVVEYLYDENGNLIEDKNRNIETTYNYLSLPVEVRFSGTDKKIKFYYTALGQRTRQEVWEGGSMIKSTDYLSDFVYTNDEFHSFGTEEGRVVNVHLLPESEQSGYGDFVNEFYYSDHLGNVRAVFREDVSISTNEVARITSESFEEDKESKYFAENQYSDIWKGLKRTISSENLPQKSTVGSNIFYLTTGGWDEHLKLEFKVGAGVTFSSKIQSVATDNQQAQPSGITIGASSLPPTGDSDNPFSMGSVALTASYDFGSSGSGNTENTSFSGNSYLRVLYYNESGTLLDQKNVEIEAGSEWTEFSTPELTTTESGRIEVLLVNTSQEVLYFDDWVNTTNLSSELLQTNHFYPYGMNMEGIEEHREFVDNHQYQGKELQRAHDLEWYDFHARQYHPAMARWMNVDPQNQFASPYVAMGNNPGMGIDPDGEWVHLAIGAVIGGTMNVILNRDKIGGDFWKGAGYFAIGAAVGALTAGVGAGVGVALSGGAFGAGFLGTSSVAVSTSFLTGAAVGGATGFVSGFGLGTSNSLMEGHTINQSLSTGLLKGWQGALSGALIGGVIGGISAELDGRRFIDGAGRDDIVQYDVGLPYVEQEGKYNCGAAQAESISRRKGGDLTQEIVRGELGGDPDKVGLVDNEVFGKLRESGLQTTGAQRGGISESEIISHARDGNILSFSKSSSQAGVHHSVSLNRITLRVITKRSGKVVTKYLYYVMDSSKGQYVPVSNASLTRKGINYFITFASKF